MGLKSRKRTQNASHADGATPPEERDADFSVLEGGRPEEDQEHGQETAQAQPGAQADPAELTALRAELQEFKDKYLRALAEVENVRKRGLKERSDLLKYQGEPLIIDLLEVVDSFDRALEHTGSDPKLFEDGVRLIHKQLTELLGRWDVRSSPGMGKQFDPHIHRAIGKAPVEGTAPGTIIGELKKAYFYKDRMIRPGEVMVAEGPAEDSPSTESAAPGSSEDDQGGDIEA